MRVRGLAWTAVVAGGIGLWAGNALSQEGGGKEAPAKDPMAEWAEWMELQAPNENHARLRKLVGDWDVDSTFWMTPGAEPMKSKAKASFHSILDGRYLRHEYAGDVAGMPFQGVSLMGYDNFKKKQISCWADSTSTGFFLTEGTHDEKTGITTEEGSMPMSPDAPPILHRMTTRMTDDDTMVMEMYSKGEDGEMHKGMELVYHRKKASPEKEPR